MREELRHEPNIGIKISEHLQSVGEWLARAWAWQLGIRQIGHLRCLTGH